MLAAMPGQPSPTSERSGECVHGECCVELYDDPATSLVVPCFSPTNGIEQVDYAATEGKQAATSFPPFILHSQSNNE